MGVWKLTSYKLLYPKIPKGSMMIQPGDWEKAKNVMVLTIRMRQGDISGVVSIQPSMGLGHFDRAHFYHILHIYMYINIIDTQVCIVRYIQRNSHFGQQTKVQKSPALTLQPTSRRVLAARMTLPTICLTGLVPSPSLLQLDGVWSDLST